MGIHLRAEHHGSTQQIKHLRRGTLVRRALQISSSERDVAQDSSLGNLPFLAHHQLQMILITYIMHALAVTKRRGPRHDP